MDFKNLGNLIKSKRVENGFTQSYIAEKVGISSQHYSRLERGLYTPSLQTFINLVRILKLNLLDLDTKNNKKITSTMYEILHILENLSPTKQESVLSFLKTIIL
jgi:transcriptional regulator with XRE-family HTH domain